MFNSSVSRQVIAFFTYAVQGNLLEEKGKETDARDSYNRAFSYTGEANLDFNQTTIEDALRQLFATTQSEEHNQETNFLHSFASDALKKHYDFRTRQLIRELDAALAQEQWRVRQTAGPVEIRETESWQTCYGSRLGRAGVPRPVTGQPG